MLQNGETNRRSVTIRIGQGENDGTQNEALVATCYNQLQVSEAAAQLVSFTEEHQSKDLLGLGCKLQSVAKNSDTCPRLFTKCPNIKQLTV